MAVTVAQLITQFPGLLEFSTGSKEQVISSVCADTTLCEAGIIFVHTEKVLKAALESPVSTIVMPSQWPLPESPTPKTILTSPQAKVAMALVIQKFFAPVDQWADFDGEKIHPSAIISKSAKIGENVTIGPHVVISEGCQLDEGCFIGANCTLEPRVFVGADSIIHPNVFIARDCIIGKKCEVQSMTSIGSDGFGYATDNKGKHHRIPHLGKVILEDDVHIGNNVSIDRGTFHDTKIGSGTRMDNHGHIGHNNILGEDNLITAGFISAGSTTIGDHCIMAGRVSVNGHINIGDNVIIGPLSAVVGNINKPGAYAGYPVQEMKEAKKTLASLASLPKLRKTVAKLVKKVGLEENE